MMRRRLALLTACAWFGGHVGGAEAPSFPHFQEVLRLIRSELPGVSEEEINRALVGGLLDHFHPRVLLVTNTPAGGAAVGAGAVRRTAVYDEGMGYLGVGRVDAGLAVQVSAALGELERTQRLHGVVLDLRRAGGDDYRAAAELADRFVAVADRPLLRWEGIELRSTAKSAALAPAVVVLVNGDTSGAAEALAAALREAAPALVVGSRTSGRAQVDRVFSLEGGVDLRIATAAVVAGDNRELRGGVVPDIGVESPTADLERLWLEDPFLVPTNAVAPTSTRSRPRMNEAELVRRREGDRGEGGAPGASTAAVKPSLQDPVLGRALDLLKGLAVVQRSGGR